MFQRNKCKHYDNCNAPICPNLSDEQNSDCIWYPFEEICRKRKGVPAWIKQQRKVAKKAKPENYQFYFLLDMLKVPFRVTKSVKGLDPDQPLEKEGRQLKAWRKKFIGSKTRKLTAEHREKLKRAAEKARKAKQQKRKLEMGETTKSESIMPSQLISMEDLSMKNQMITTTGQEVC